MTAAGADPGPPSDIADEGLAEAGRARIDWARRGMPVLRLITPVAVDSQPPRTAASRSGRCSWSVFTRSPPSSITRSGPAGPTPPASSARWMCSS